jgi:hypothetical protein
MKGIGAIHLVFSQIVQVIGNDGSHVLYDATPVLNNNQLRTF